MNGKDQNARAAPLNPALKRGTDTTFNTEETTPAPIETASATGSEGKGWPWIWLVVFLFCVALSVYLVV